MTEWYSKAALRACTVTLLTAALMMDAVAEAGSFSPSPTNQTAAAPEEARARYIESIIADPNNEAAWAGLERLAFSQGYVVWRFSVPILARVAKEGEKVSIILDTSLLTGQSDAAVAATWLVYAAVKASWRTEEYFKANPGAKEYRLTFDEEYASFEGALKAWKELRQKSADLPYDNFDTLLAIYEDGFLDAYIYLQEYRGEFADSYAEWKKRNPQKMLQYFNKYVLLPKDNLPEHVKKDLEKEKAGEHNHSHGAAFTSTADTAEDLNRWKEELQKQFEKLKIIKAEQKAPKNRSRIKDLSSAEAAAYMMIGIHYRHLRQYRESLQYHNKAIALFTKSNRLEEVALNYSLKGNTYASMKDLSKAIQFKELALKTYKRANVSLPKQVIFLLSMTAFYGSSDMFEQSIARGREAFLIAKREGSAELVHEVVNTMGTTYNRAFKGISWNLQTGRAKEAQMDDFVNDGEIGQGVEKYGRRSPAEDLATFTTLTVMQRSNYGNQEKGRLAKHIRKEMLEGNFAPAAKYLFTNFVRPLYSIATEGEDVTVVITGRRRSYEGPKFPLPAVIEALRGNMKPFIDYFRKTNLYTEQQLDELYNSFSPLENDISFEEVRANLRRVQSAGGYIPGHVLATIKLYEDAYNFAKEHDIIQLSQGRRPDAKEK